MANIFLFLSLSPKENRYVLAIEIDGPESPMHTIPTGFSLVPPPGPAMPVVDMA